MYDQIYKRIDDNLWKDAGCGSELDYVEQSSWILFLKYLDDLETSREEAAELDGRDYEPIIAKKFRWSTWAVPKKKNGERDIAKTCPGAGLAKGLSISGSSAAGSKPQVEKWLKSNGLI